MYSVYKLCVILAAFLLNEASALNILFFIPCYGGHFGTLSTLLVPLCKTNNCTVFESAKLCEKKLESFRKIVNFEVIKNHGLPDEYSIRDSLEFSFDVSSHRIELYEFGYESLTEVLEDRSRPVDSRFDILITDSAIVSTLTVAERFDLPVIGLSIGVPGGVECIEDKWKFAMHELFLFKPFARKCWQWLKEKRDSLKLPELEYQGEFLTTEYTDRFPMMIPTSPKIYPKPHEKVEHLYIGGLRKEESYAELDPEIENWISKNDLDVVYMSLGTHAKLDEDSLNEIVTKLKAQKKYRFIWSLDLGLEKIAEKSGVLSETTDNLYLTGYLSQFILLGNSKVKVFVSHCGLGSIVDLVSRKIPGVFLPQFSEQFANAAKLDSLSVGVTLKELKVEKLLEAIDQVIGNYSVHQKSLNKLANQFSSYENHEKIIEFVDKIASRKHVSMWQKLPYHVHCSRIHVGWQALKVAIVLIALIMLWLVWEILCCLCCRKRSVDINKKEN